MSEGLSFIEWFLLRYAYLVGQPIYRAENKELYGIEILTRFKDETTLRPYFFFQELVKDWQKVVFFYKWQIQELLKLSFPREVKIFVNLLPEVMLYFSVLTSLFEDFISTHQGQIVFEISETYLGSWKQNVREFSTFLKKTKESLGNVNFFVDDFGAWNSFSFSLICTDLIEGIKLDTQFVKQLSSEANDKALTITKHLLLLSKKLGLITCAEGVESEDVYEKLKSLEVDLLQGFYFCEPKELSFLLEILNKRTPNERRGKSEVSF